MRSLPVISPRELKQVDQAGGKPEPAPKRLVGHMRPFVCHLLRVAMIGLLLVGLHKAAKSRAQVNGNGSEVWQSIVISKHLPGAETLVASSDGPLRKAVDKEGQTVAILAISSPTADHIVGYSGPTSLLLVMTDERLVSDVKVLKSFDTPEHLRQVIESEKFWTQFKGMKWGEADYSRIDGVSGATLTSLAIAESVATTLASGSGNSSGALEPMKSLKFPDELTQAEVRAWLLPPEEASETVVSNDKDVPDELGRIAVSVSEDEARWVVRTGPLTDDISGYQGPTEVLLCLDANDKVVDVRLRKSFDNEPYVRYTKQERSFWKKFKGRTLTELAALDLKAETIDGVSGATMTSIAVADTIREASKQWLSLREKQLAASKLPAVPAAPRDRVWNFSLGEVITILFAVAAIPWSASKWRGDRRARLVWQVLCFIGIAIMSGNLLSIALFSGWTRGGVSYYFAPGLSVLLIISFAMAIFKKRNVYCDHLCPHGILQQWIRPTRSSALSRVGEGLRKLFTASWTTKILNASAMIFIALGGLVLIRPWEVNLAWLEPFDAYLLGIGFSFSSLVAVASLLAARTSPMYYCRNACPTGKVFDYVRRDSKSDRIGWVDVGLLVACGAIWIS